MCIHEYLYIRLLLVTVMDGNYTEWSPWGNCSATCGGGLKQRQRTCTNPKPGYGGKDCAAIGSDTDSAVCNLNPCPGKALFSTSIVSEFAPHAEVRDHLNSNVL